MLDMIKFGSKKSRLSLDQVEINSDQNEVPKEKKTELQSLRTPETAIQAPEMVQYNRMQCPKLLDTLLKSKLEPETELGFPCWCPKYVSGELVGCPGYGPNAAT